MAARLRACRVGADRPRPELGRRSRQRARPAEAARRRRARRAGGPRGRPRLPTAAPATSSRCATPPTPSQAQPGRPRPKRIENGQIAIVESVDPKRDTLTLLLREPGAEPRIVEIDQARLRAEHAAGKRAAAIRLNYALHSFPAQGATVHGTATLAGHWSQAKQETYVGDTRAIYRHTVHLAREDLGTDGTDEDRIGRYAQRISANRQRHASIRQPSTRTQQLAVRPARTPTDALARRPCPAAGPTRRVARDPASSTRDMSPSTAAPAAASDLRPRSSPTASARPAARTCPPAARAPLSDLPEHQIRALGPAPQERDSTKSDGSARRNGSRRSTPKPTPQSGPPHHDPPSPIPSHPDTRLLRRRHHRSAAARRSDIRASGSTGLDTPPDH